MDSSELWSLQGSRHVLLHMAPPPVQPGGVQISLESRCQQNKYLDSVAAQFYRAVCSNVFI
jgi:hypothetical protein